ncbi:hypothetical protein MBH78_18030 [Oceanimonas sp. NS1]|nr:hypothetical protein [Oceanimonas sp. NS1]
MLEPVVIIGTGHGGYQLAAALRARSPELPITLFTADDGAPLQQAGAVNALALRKDGDGLVSETALAWEQRLGVRVYPHTRVEKSTGKANGCTPALANTLMVAWCWPPVLRPSRFRWPASKAPW